MNGVEFLDQFLKNNSVQQGRNLVEEGQNKYFKWKIWISTNKTFENIEPNKKKLNKSSWFFLKKVHDFC